MNNEIEILLQDAEEMLEMANDVLNDPNANNKSILEALQMQEEAKTIINHCNNIKEV